MRLILGGLLLCTACQSTHSQLSHRWGRTLNDKSKIHFDCKEDLSLEAEFQSYIREHVQHLSAGNKEVFSEALAPEKFCVVPVDYPAIDAGASLDGSLFINTGVVKAAATDAQFAAVIAHEMAHITRRHGDTEIEAFVAENPQYLKEYTALEQLRPKTLRPAHVSAQDWLVYEPELKSLVKKSWNRAKGASGSAQNLCKDVSTVEKPSPLRQRIQKQSIDPDFEAQLCQLHVQQIELDAREGILLSNWKEIEADEVGYEFYLRAGYPTDDYAQFFANAAQLSGKRDGDCQRGEADHPRDCWRAQNIREELRAHAQDFVLSMTRRDLPFKISLQSLKKKYP